MWKNPTSPAIKRGARAGYTKAKPLRREVKVAGEVHKEHRLIWQWLYGDLTDSTFIDHIDGNTLNNYPTNLRKANNTQNQYNQKLSCKNTSGIKGVSWHKTRNKWKAALRTKGGRTFKYFDTIEEAERWVREARETYHGDFARHG